MISQAIRLVALNIVQLLQLNYQRLIVDANDDEDDQYNQPSIKWLLIHCYNQINLNVLSIYE